MGQRHAAPDTSPRRIDRPRANKTGHTPPGCSRGMRPRLTAA
jgi:hypothetical protein